MWYGMYTVFGLHFTQNMHWKKYTLEFSIYDGKKCKEKKLLTKAKHNLSAQDLPCNWRWRL